MVAEFVLGIITSIIGGIILVAIRPPSLDFSEFDSTLLIWVASVLISLALGVLVGVFAFRMFSRSFSMMVGAEIGIVLAGMISVGGGLLTTVFFYNHARANLMK